MEFSSKGILESFRFWKQGRGAAPVAYHLVGHRLPTHWGYAVTGGVNECVRRMGVLEKQGLQVDLIRHTLRHYLPLGSGGEINDFLDYLRQLPLSFRADGIPDANVIFGSQPLMELIGPASLVSLFAYNLADTLQTGINTASNFSRLRSVIGEESQLIEGLFQKGWVSECAAFSGANALSSPVEDSAYSLIARAGGQDQLLSYQDRVMSFYPVEGVRYIDSLQVRPNALVISQRSLEGELSEVRRALDEKGFQETRIWCSTEGLSIKKVKSLVDAGNKPDGWIVEAFGLLRDVDSGSMAVSVALSAIEIDGKWKPIGRRLHGTAFRSYPGILNIRRYGVRKPEEEGGQWVKYSGDLIVCEHDEEIGDTLVEDSRFLSRRIAGSVRNLFEPLLSGGKGFLFSPELSEQANLLKSELELFDKGHRAVEFPTVYRSGLEQQLYQRTVTL